MRGQDVTLEAVAVTYPGGFTAVHPTDLHVRAGEFFSILGPSGCGKTTILRAVSGFVAPSAGRISIGGADQAGRRPDARPTALIFQNLALFPLMRVWENVAFGLEARGVARRARRAKADELLSLVALSDQADKMPGELSGGQRQRVAIARALAVEPAVLLLDEPLSALDLKLRQHMRAELRKIQRLTGVTFVYITHDQGEALTMSDRIAVMTEGRIEQVGTGDEVYTDPRTAFVASFVGEANQFRGRVTDIADGTARIDTPLGPMRGRAPVPMVRGVEAILFARPEILRFGASENVVEATLTRRDLEGPFIVLEMRAGRHVLKIQMPNDGTPPPSGVAQIGFDPKHAVVLPAGPVASTGVEDPG